MWYNLHGLFSPYAMKCKPREIKRCHITSALKQLHWSPITSRIQYKILMLTFKCLNDLAPKYLKELLKLRKAFRCTRSACDDLLLEVGKTRLATAGDCAFVNVGPFLWNRLPYSVRACNTVDTFKSRLKTHLFKQYLY